MKRLLLAVLLVCCVTGARADGLVLPVDTLTVEARAFYGDGSITDVTLPDRIRRIESEAFAGTGLTVVTLPASLTFIAPDAFDGAVRFRVTPGTYAAGWAEGRTVVDAPWPEGLTAGVVTEGPDAPYAVITGYTGPDTALVLPDRTLEGVVVREIGENAFSGTAITSVILPDTLAVIGKDAFSHCTELAAVDLPDTLTTIGRDAFNDCTALGRVDVPDNVTSIGDHAFYGCESLTAVILPAGLTAPGFGAFADCRSLREVTVSADADTENVFNQDSNIETIRYLCGPSGSMPDWISSSQRVETQCMDQLRTVEVGEGITVIGAYVFSDERFQSLETVVLPGTLRSVGEYAFSNLGSLRNVNFPDGLESIGDYAFSYCFNLPRPSLPGVTLGEYAFDGCPAPGSREESIDTEE